MVPISAPIKTPALKRGALRMTARMKPGRRQHTRWYLSSSPYSLVADVDDEPKIRGTSPRREPCVG